MGLTFAGGLLNREVHGAWSINSKNPLAVAPDLLEREPICPWPGILMEYYPDQP